MGMMPTRAFPQYTVFGPDSALSIRSILPTFKRAGNDGVSVERRGKLVLEFIPRNQTGAGFMWQEKTVFSLSVEEVGLFVSQLPGSGVELSHAAHNASYDRDDANSGVTQLSGDVVEKVLTIEQGEGSAVLFKVDYMKDGVGGQSPPGQESFPVSCTTLLSTEAAVHYLHFNCSHLGNVVFHKFAFESFLNPHCVSNKPEHSIGSYSASW